jgi:hypothetical protein
MVDPAVLAGGRAFAAVNFDDRCVIERPGAPVTNVLTGEVYVPMTPVYGTLAEPGVCRFKQTAAPWAGPATVGEAGVGLSSGEVQLPVVGSESITVNDVCTCVAALNDTDLVGRRFRVMGADHASTHKTTRKVPIMEVLS